MTWRGPLQALETAVNDPAQTEITLDFTGIYNEYFRTIYRWVWALGGPESEAEDLTQEVFMVVQRKLPEFDGRHLSAWLYRITALTVRDHRRGAWFRHIFRRPREVLLEEVGGHAVGSDELLERKEEQQAFYRLTRKMSSKWRDSFILFEILGHSSEEIAELQGIPPATVRTHLHRARKEFSALVGKETR
jgi:RNA polymerase sigma-70 factor (ECF subfamily)